MSVELTLLISVASLFLAYMGYRKGILDATKHEGEAAGRVEADLQYLTRLTEDILIAQRDTRKLIDDLMERVTRNEESIKSVKKQVDKIEDGRG